MPRRCSLRLTLRLALALAPALPGPVAARESLPSFAGVLAKAEPAVMNIATVGHAGEEGEPETMQDFLRRFFGEGPHVEMTR